MNGRHRGASTESPAAIGAEGPLRRWARRKRGAAREKEAPDEARRRGPARAPSRVVGDVHTPAGDASAPAAVEGKAPIGPEPAVVEGKVSTVPEPAAVEGKAPTVPEPAVAEEEVLTDEDMPPLDSLDQDSDYSGFLYPGVSEGLRRRALRKLFTSAVFNVPDGLDDYDEDFTSFEALGDIVTSDMRHQAEVEAERSKQARAGTRPAAGLQDETAPAHAERPAHPDGEEAETAREDPAGSAEPAGPPVLADSGDPDGIAGDAGLQPAERGAQARPGKEPAPGPDAPAGVACGEGPAGLTGSARDCAGDVAPGSAGEPDGGRA